jgi:cobalamin transport system substrate-binding protein
MIMKATTRPPAIAAAVAVALTLLAACAGSSSTGKAAGTPATSGFPVRVLTADGPIVVRSRPASIVSLSPTATEMLYAIGAGTQVKAVDKYSNFPPDAPTTDLSALRLNVESLIAMKPDLILVADPVAKLTERMKALSIPVLRLPAATKIEDVYAEMSELGQATGHVPQARTEAASIRAQLGQVASGLPHRPTPLTYYFELTPNYYTVTSDSFVGQLLQMVGLRSIADSASGAAKSSGYPQLSGEFIVKADPNFVLLADTVCCHQTAAAVANRPGWHQLTAVREHHVVALNDDIASRWGPRIVVLLRTVARAVGQKVG